MSKRVREECGTAGEPGAKSAGFCGDSAIVKRVATKTELRQEIAELRNVGAQMANICWNIAQGRQFTAYDRDITLVGKVFQPSRFKRLGKQTSITRSDFTVLDSEYQRSTRWN